ncbi:MAG TPA: alpha/beta hydrolase [Bryobacteraceae bacterium]|nr:alpha/beta hydrolase [Bryobacteraceae bacterium]
MFRLICPLLLLAAGAAAELRSDIEFARRGDQSLTLDAWVPDGSGPFPAVIIVHGGGFVRGDKQTYVKPLFPVLTNAGFAWFTINYRLAPANRYPDPVRDVEDAVRWVMKHASEYKVDPKRVALTGESAGGHMVADVAVHSARKLGLRTVIPIYAPSDLLKRAQDSGISENIQHYLGIDKELSQANVDLLRKASPLHHVTRDIPPVLLIHGTNDAQVPYDQSVRMLEKLKAAGVDAKLITVQDGAHGMGSWAKLPASKHWETDLVGWLREKLR